MGAVWSVPVILAATAAPAAAASVHHAPPPPPTPVKVTATATLIHDTAQDYWLTMNYTVSGDPGETTTVSITQISTVTTKGNKTDTVLFTLPPAQSMSVGSQSVKSEVTRQGDNSGAIVTVYFSYPTTTAAGQPTRATSSVDIAVPLG
jgi:hypothetical protein